jgi:hypothetical protein
MTTDKQKALELEADRAALGKPDAGWMQQSTQTKAQPPAFVKSALAWLETVDRDDADFNDLHTIRKYIAGLGMERDTFAAAFEAREEEARANFGDVIDAPALRSRIIELEAEVARQVGAIAQLQRFKWNDERMRSMEAENDRLKALLTEALDDVPDHLLLYQRIREALESQ